MQHSWCVYLLPPTVLRHSLSNRCWSMVSLVVFFLLALRVVCLPPSPLLLISRVFSSGMQYVRTCRDGVFGDAFVNLLFRRYQMWVSLDLWGSIPIVTCQNADFRWSLHQNLSLKSMRLSAPVGFINSRESERKKLSENEKRLLKKD